MADLLKETFAIETTLTPGAVGEFTVWVEGKLVAEKGPQGFPTEPEIVESVKGLQAR